MRGTNADADGSLLRRFAATAGQLRELLQSDGGGERELLLRAAMRRTLRELSEVSGRAARSRSAAATT